MTTENSPFTDLGHLRMAFSQGLHRLLDMDSGMGAFILVLANAHSLPQDNAELSTKLDQRYAELADACRQLLATGQPISAPLDDLMVLLKLMVLGYDSLPTPQQRNLGPWQLQFNLLRSLRPERACGAEIRQILQPFNPDGFHFNKGFLATETFWRGSYLGHPVALLYNKFPFMPLHGLWVPDPTLGLPQYLLAQWHQYAWSCCAQLAQRIPGLGFGYNSLGAGASVNHLHFQLFVSADLPVEAAQWQHQGGSQDYPAHCQRFDDAETAWAAIEHCHRQNLAYNILYRGRRCYLFQRRLPGQFDRHPWLSALGWSELCGRFVLFNQQYYQGLEAEQIEAQLQALNP